MTRVEGPMFSVTASGCFADILVYSHWKGLPYVRCRVIPENPRTPGQVGIRTVLTHGVGKWQDPAMVPEEDKLMWEANAEGTGMSGFNRFMSFYMKANYLGVPPWVLDPQELPEPQ